MAMVREELVEGPGAVVLRFPGPARPVRRPRLPSAGRRAIVARRRLGVGLAGLVLVAAMVLATGPRRAPVASRPGTPARITVAQGETVWDLAERYAPDGIDRRAYVASILELNRLDGMPLAGQRLKLPK